MMNRPAVPTANPCVRRLRCCFCRLCCGGLIGSLSLSVRSFSSLSQTKSSNPTTTAKAADAAGESQAAKKKSKKKKKKANDENAGSAQVNGTSSKVSAHPLAGHANLPGS